MYADDVIVRKLAMSTFKERIKWFQIGDVFVYRSHLDEKRYLKYEIYTDMEDELFLMLSFFSHGRIMMTRSIKDTERKILKKVFKRKGLIN